MLGEVLPSALAEFKPQLVLYDGGIDVHKDDALGRLALTDQGLMRRELQVCPCHAGMMTKPGVHA